MCTHGLSIVNVQKMWRIFNYHHFRDAYVIKSFSDNFWQMFLLSVSPLSATPVSLLEDCTYAVQCAADIARLLSISTAPQEWAPVGLNVFPPDGCNKTYITWTKDSKNNNLYQWRHPVSLCANKFTLIIRPSSRLMPLELGFKWYDLHLSVPVKISYGYEGALTIIESKDHRENFLWSLCYGIPIEYWFS